MHGHNTQKKCTHNDKWLTFNTVLCNHTHLVVKNIPWKTILSQRASCRIPGITALMAAKDFGPQWGLAALCLVQHETCGKEHNNTYCTGLWNQIQLSPKTNYHEKSEIKGVVEALNLTSSTGSCQHVRAFGGTVVCVYVVCVCVCVCGGVWKVRMSARGHAVSLRRSTYSANSILLKSSKGSSFYCRGSGISALLHHFGHWQENQNCCSSKFGNANWQTAIGSRLTMTKPPCKESAAC